MRIHLSSEATTRNSELATILVGFAAKIEIPRGWVPFIKSCKLTRFTVFKLMESIIIISVGALFSTMRS